MIAQMMNAATDVATRTFGGLVSRSVHALSQPFATAAPSAPFSAASEGRAVLERAPRDLAAARVLKDWWESRGVEGHFVRKVTLTRTFNRPDSAFAFFDSIPLSGGDYPVMGVVQDMFYDHPKVHPGNRGMQQEWLRQQLREFVMRYFMRVSDFFDPEAYVDEKERANWKRGSLSWCPEPRRENHGFGFSQHYFRTRQAILGQIPEPESYRIMDLRDVSRALDWLLLRVKIYDFSLNVHLGSLPAVAISAGEASWLALAPDFLCDREHPEPGVHSEYGLGYAFVRNPTTGLVAYGPGEFDAAFKLIRFRLLDTGQVQVRMVFVSNRANGVLRVRIDATHWLLRGMDWASLGIASELVACADRNLTEVSNGFSFDPIFAYVSLANFLSGNRAAREYCISRDALDFMFLLQHFRVHFKALGGSLVTWRLVPDWTDEVNVPDWAKFGVTP